MKSVLNMIMMSFACIGVVSILWVAFGYSLTFTGTNPFIGTFEAAGLSGTIDAVSGTTPELAFVAFQLAFAIITPALIGGAIADRAKFGAWIVFAVVWSVLVYFPWRAGCSTSTTVTVAGSPIGSRPSTSRAAPPCTSTPALRRWR